MDRLQKSADNNAETCKHLATEKFSVATVLIVTYLFETVVQILLTVTSYYNQPNSTNNWLWILLIAWLSTSVFVSILSIAWTFLSLDFSGRVCGRLLCYLMHFLLLGFLWRFLKIALAYEKPDVVEFLKLRKVQIYFQALPLVVVHVGYCSWYFGSVVDQGNKSILIACLLTGELLCSVISLSLHGLLKQKTNNLCDDTDHKPHRLVTLQEINVTVSRILFLISRVITIGLLLVYSSTWALLIIPSHVLMTFLWMVLTSALLSCNKSGEPVDDREEIVKFKSSLISSFALFWDVMDGRRRQHILVLTLPVLLVLVENLGVVIFYLKDASFFVVVSGICFVCGGVLYVGGVVGTSWRKWSRGKDGSWPVVDPEELFGRRRKKCVNEMGERNNETSDDINSECIGTIVNETLMTVKKEEEDADENSSAAFHHHSPITLVPYYINNFIQQKGDGNTLSSTSSRNTNTVSSSTLRNEPEEGLDQGVKAHRCSPPEIRKASKVVLKPAENVYFPNPNRRRCHCKQPKLSDKTIYEKLIEDAYGILICEGDTQSKSPKKLRVLCAKCLGNHDPLLSNCLVCEKMTCIKAVSDVDSPSDDYSETTEYPTDTEFTCNLNENESVSTHFDNGHLHNSSHNCRGTQLNHIFASAIVPTTAEIRKKELTGMEYVRAWLLMNDVEARREWKRGVNATSTRAVTLQPPPLKKIHPVDDTDSQVENCTKYQIAPEDSIIIQDFSDIVKSDFLVETVV